MIVGIVINGGNKHMEEEKYQQELARKQEAVKKVLLEDASVIIGLTVPAIANIWWPDPLVDGEEKDLAVVFFDVDTTHENAVSVARNLGWTGERVEVRMLPKDRCEHFAAKAVGPARRWLLNRKKLRVLVLRHGIPLFVNYTPGVGHSFEPGILEGKEFKELN